MATDRPRTMASPDLAGWPDIAATRPNLMVSSANAGAENAKAAPTSSVRRDRDRMVDMGAPPLTPTHWQASCQRPQTTNSHSFNGLMHCPAADHAFNPNKPV